MSNYLPETHENSDRSIVLGRSKAESEGQISISAAAAQSFAPQAVADSRQNELPRPYNGSEPFVFISYSHKDFTEAVSIIKALQTSNYRVWYDDGIDPGTEWDDTIAAHVENCGLFAALISTNYLNSDNCKDELSFARDLSKNRLLIYLENVTLPRGLAMRLNRLQAIHKYRYGDFAAFCKKLYETQGLDICLDVSADERIKEQTVAQPQQVHPHVVSSDERIEMPDLNLTDKPQSETNANLADSVGLHGSALDQSPKAVEQEQLPSDSAEIKNIEPTDSVERKLLPQAALYEPEAMIEPDVCVGADVRIAEEDEADSFQQVSEQISSISADLNIDKASSSPKVFAKLSAKITDMLEPGTVANSSKVREIILADGKRHVKLEYFDSIKLNNTEYWIMGNRKSEEQLLFGVFKKLGDGDCSTMAFVSGGKSLNRVYWYFLKNLLEAHESEYVVTDYTLCQPRIQEKKRYIFTLNTAKGLFGSKLKDIIKIPDKYEVIAGDAFRDTGYFMEKVDKIIIPKSVKKIGNHAFGFIQAQEIIIPNSVVEIGEHAFCLSEDGFIRCDEGSAAYRYAVANKLRNTVDIKREDDKRKSEGVCRHCGGRFKGLFKKNCSKCGAPKDY